MLRGGVKNEWFASLALIVLFQHCPHPVENMQATAMNAYWSCQLSGLRCHAGRFDFSAVIRCWLQSVLCHFPHSSSLVLFQAHVNTEICASAWTITISFYTFQTSSNKCLAALIQRPDGPRSYHPPHEAPQGTRCLQMPACSARPPFAPTPGAGSGQTSDSYGNSKRTPLSPASSFHKCWGAAANLFRCNQRFSLSKRLFGGGEACFLGCQPLVSGTVGRAAVLKLLMLGLADALFGGIVFESASLRCFAGSVRAGGNPSTCTSSLAKHAPLLETSYVVLTPTPKLVS